VAVRRQPPAFPRFTVDPSRRLVNGIMPCLANRFLAQYQTFRPNATKVKQERSIACAHMRISAKSVTKEIRRS
jgi:hypothetical protein